MDYDPVRKSVKRSSSSAAYRKKRSIGLGQHKQDREFHVINHREKINNSEPFKVSLERVIGLTVNTNSQIAVDGTSGIIAYTAGCVVVLQGKTFQGTIINNSKKTITALAFSSDGRYLALGESGHAPAVRVFEVCSRLQLAEFSGHKFGVTCVAFSPNGKYIVSVGTQHDMVANVWNWRQNVKVASNKISSKVNGLAFSSDGTTFITIGVRHVKYWFLGESRRKTTIQNKNETVPLLGRSGLLGDQKTNVFVDVACGVGARSGWVYVISQNGVLCQLHDRLISKTIDLKTIRAYCMQVSEELVIVGCANGVIRVFDADTLNYMYTLHQPHPLGISVADNSMMAVEWEGEGYKYPDTLGMVLCETSMTLTVVYSDRSMYQWDLSRLPQIGRLSASLFHSSCVWSVDVLPPVESLPADTFVTCSSDDTIRFWNVDPSAFQNTHHRKPSFNQELLNIIYTDPSLGSLCEHDYNTDKPDIYESRNGIKCICSAPDGSHLASGDLVGNIRVHDIETMSQIHIIEAHDTGVLSLEYSDYSTGWRYLVSASRDRMIHVFDVANNYDHLQTLSDHSSSVCSVKLIPLVDGMMMVSCSNDKSLLFRMAVHEEDQLNFQLKQNLMSKGTPNDMVVDPSRRTAATACQDRMIRLYNTQTAKQKRNYKGSNSEDGFLCKITIDSTGTFLAVSCSDKSVAIIEFQTGEIVATLVGHSELITGLQFTNDCSYLISVSADGCMFLWRLDDRLVDRMFSSRTLRRANSEVLSQPKPDVTLVTPHESKTSLLAGKSTGDLAHQQDFDETTFVVRQSNSSVLPAWAKERRNWDKGRVTPVMTSLKNGEVHMSPDSAKLANGSNSILPIAVQSQLTSSPAADDGEEGTDNDEDEDVFDKQFLEGHTNSQLKLSLNNNIPNYEELPPLEPLYYQPPPLEKDEEFIVTHRSYNGEDERSSTSEAMSLNTMESGDDILQTPASTPASSVPSTPVSSDSHLLDILQQITANSDYLNRQTRSSRRSKSASGTLTFSLSASIQQEQAIGASAGKSANHGFPLKKTGRKDTPSDTNNDRPNSMAHRPQAHSVSFAQHSSTDSLTSTEELLPGASNQTLTNVTPNDSVHLKSSENSSNGAATFDEIDKLCTALRSNLSTAQKLLQQVRDEDNSEKDYLVETLRDVCDGFHQMLPPSAQFEAVVHQTVHQFLLMNKTQKLLENSESVPSEKR